MYNKIVFSLLFEGMPRKWNLDFIIYFFPTQNRTTLPLYISFFLFCENKFDDGWGCMNQGEKLRRCYGVWT